MNQTEFSSWCAAGFEQAAKPLIMGILNITPDSFSDGGQYDSLPKALDQAMRMIAAGADLIDIGGESTRPGAPAIGLAEELERVIPVIEALANRTDCCLSIDSYKPEVMRAAVQAGAGLINDVFALQASDALATVAALAVPVCIMHMQGKPKTMQDAPTYPRGVVTELIDFFQQRITAMTEAGIKKEQIILDPGFGFGKLVSHNLQLVYDLQEFKRFGRPILLGASRKSSIGQVLNQPVEKRLTGSLAIAAYAMLKGVGIIRTHDVDETRQVVTMVAAIEQAYGEIR